MQTVFNGQQEGERIFHTVKPHWLYRWSGIFWAVIFGIIVTSVVMFIRFRLYPESESNILFSAITGFIAALLMGWWNEIVYEKSRAYITDRRIVRIEAKFPCFETKRSFFWNEVAKVKSFPPNLFFRFLKIGTLEVQPTVPNISDIRLKWTYYFEDLANYLDKILFLHKSKPDELLDLNTFVEKPKGMRF